MNTTTKPDQPATDDLFTQCPSTEQADARSTPPETSGPQSDTGTPLATPSSNAAPTTRSTWELVWMALLVVSLSLASGAVGALVSPRLFPPPPPVKIGVISLTRLTRAITDTEPSTSATFATRFDHAAKQLVESEPGLVLFVKEAVIDTGQLVDYTTALLPLFTNKTHTSTVSPPPPNTPGPTPPTE